MILEQHYLACLSHASYLIGDETTKSAVVVDPQRDVERYVESAKRQGLAIERVFLTHFHADFVSGHLELAQRTGASIHLGHSAKTEYASSPVKQGDRFDLGSVVLEVLETPGHTLESISLLVHDKSIPAAPHAVLTGDALFLGDVGRPDLLVAEGVSAEHLAGLLYDSLHSVLARLPDSVLVYPAHGAGSACGKNISKDLVGTLGAQRASNWALQPMAKPEFVRQLTRDALPAPGYFALDAKLNRSTRARLEKVLESALRPLSLERVLALAAQGALLLDTREPDDYARAHLSGSMNVGLSGRFASWVGTLVPPDRKIVIVANPGRERESALRLGRIGFDSIEGYLDVSAASEAVRAAPGKLARAHARVGAAEFERILDEESDVVLVDVRSPAEFAAGRLPGSINFPLETLPQSMASLAAQVAPGRQVALHCLGGYRSSIAASLLEAQGVRVRADLIGGFSAWHAAGLPVQR